MFDMSSEHP